MVYVGTVLPKHLENDPAVKFFNAIPGWPTATQAQCIRLLYPALLQTQDAVMISDMDMIPLQRTFFTHGFHPFNNSQFVSLRGIDEGERQVYMCYVGAEPRTFGALFGIQSLNNIYERLAQWGCVAPSDGIKGKRGWCIDQILLYIHIKKIPQSHLHLLPNTREFPRLDRGDPKSWLEPTNQLENDIITGEFNDFHLPYHPNIMPRVLQIYSAVPKCQIWLC
jgi:hypothetical protein